MADPYTPAELEAAAAALREVRHVIDSDGYPSIVIGTDEQDAATVLAAVLPDHDARVRADERARWVQHLRQIADQAEATWTDTDHNREIIANYRAMADVIARTHATPPTDRSRATCDAQIRSDLGDMRTHRCGEPAGHWPGTPHRYGGHWWVDDAPGAVPATPPTREEGEAE